MSAGAFSRSKYEADDGEIHPIRVQPETIDASVGGNDNTAPAGAVTIGLSARVSQSARAFGLRPRLVSLAWFADPPADYDPLGIIRIPILRKAAYDDIVVGDSGSYLGGTVIVIGKSPESKR